VLNTQVRATRKDAARAWHATVAVVVLAALVLQALLVARNGPDVNAMGPPQPATAAARLARMCCYFTIQSNILVLVGALTLALRPDRDGRLWRVVRLDGLTGIVVTALVFDLVLARRMHPIGADRFADAGLHYVSPVLVVLGWLLFGPRLRIGWSTVGWALVWPLSWLAFTFADAELTGWCPYPFLDPGEIGYPRALVATGVLVALGLAVLVMLRWLDRRLPPA
jgi:hypothetical protein